MRVIVILSGLLAFVQQGTSQTTYNVNALVGGEVILPCDYDQANDGNIITVTWTVRSGGSSINLYIRTGGTTDNQITPPAEYVGRLEMVGDVNLKLTGLTLDDERQYKCAVTASVNSETSFVNLQVLMIASVLKDTSKILLCEHGASAIVAFIWKKGGTVIIQGLIGTNGQMIITIDSMPDKTELLLQNGSPNMRLDNIEIADEGTYSCEAIEQDGTLTVLISELLVRVQPTTGPVVQVQFDPRISSMSEVPLNTTVTFTCTSTGGRPPATLGWSLTESGTFVSVSPTYRSSNNSQGVGDATSTFNFTTIKYGVTYRAHCTASGPDPIQSNTSAITSFTTEKDPSAIQTTPKGQTDSAAPGVTKASQTGGLSTGAQAGIGIGVALGCIAVAGVATYFFVVKRKKRPGRDKDDADTRDPADRYYENVAHPGKRVASQPPGSESDDYDYEIPMETVYPASPPSRPSGDYQELRPAIYQSLQKH
ncbi:uncharacterized protein LOC144879935 [Branchiostoma floridae x Branchiostoma japonicum]